MRAKGTMKLGLSDSDKWDMRARMRQARYVVVVGAVSSSGYGPYARGGAYIAIRAIAKESQVRMHDGYIDVVRWDAYPIWSGSGMSQKNSTLMDADSVCAHKLCVKMNRRIGH